MAPAADQTHARDRRGPAPERPAPGAHPIVRGNAGLLRRALGSIVRNTSQPSPRGGRLRATPAHDARTQRATVVVEDEGAGVPEDRFGPIFEPAVRAATSGEVPDFGLGLTISKLAVEAHGGTINATNRNAGGLRVAIELPCVGRGGDSQ